MKTIEDIIIKDVLIKDVLIKEGFNKVRELALEDGYTSNQVDTALKYIAKNKLDIEIKKDDLFDIKDISSNEYLDTNISFNMVVERGYDSLRSILESRLKEEEISYGVAEKLLNELNSMFENIQYSIKESENGRYLALNI